MVLSGTHSEFSYATTVLYTSYGSRILRSFKNFPTQMIVGKIGQKVLF